MTIRKASQLHDWLLGLNFRIFTWQLDIGFWIETAVDWTVSWINEAWSRAELAYNLALRAWDHTGDLLAIANKSINRLREDLLGRFSTLGSYLVDWWIARGDEVRSWINVSAETFRFLINDLTVSLQRLSNAWESFRVSTLPNLVNLSWFRSWWGMESSTFSGWWIAARSGIREERAAEIQPIADQVRNNQGIISLAREFFSDPEDQVVKILERALERLW